MLTSNSRLKTSSGARPLSSIGAEKTKTSHGVRKVKNQSSNVEKLRNLAKSNQEVSIKISDLESERDKLFERIQALQDNLIQDQDLISGLKSKVTQLTINPSSFTTTLNNTEHFHEEDEISTSTRSNFEELSIPSNCEEFLTNRPMILTYFLGYDEDFIKYLNGTDLESQSKFITKSSKQLNRFQLCFSLFQILIHKVQSYDFFPICKEYIKRIFEESSVVILIKESKTNRFEFSFDDKQMYYEINDQNSIISRSLENQEVLMNNQNTISDSLRVDVILNPNCQPSLVIPVGKESAILIISQKSGENKNFTPEDQVVAIFLSKLLKILYEQHLCFLNLMKEVELRRTISNFQREIISKNSFQLLLPYLFDFITDFTGANDINLFFVGDNSFYSILIEDDRIKKKTFPFKGIPKMIIETKKNYISEKLSSQEIKCFDPAIDMCGLNKCYAAFPIFMNDDNPNAVICIIDKNQSNSFSGFDIDFLEAISTSVGLILLKCIETSGEMAQNMPISNLKKFVSNVSSMNKTNINENDSILKLAKDTQEIFKCEWITVYSRNQRDFVKRLLTLHNDELVNKSIICEESSNAIFSKDKLIAANEMLKISHFFKISIPVVHSLLFVHDDKIAIFCFDCCSTDEIHKSILNSCLIAISYAHEIDSIKQDINDNKNSGVSLRNVFDVTSTAMQNENPLLSLLTMICDLISMSTFALFRYERKNDNYELFITGKDVKDGNIESSDSFIYYAKNVEEKPTLIDKFGSTEYTSSKILQFFPFFTHVVVCPIDVQSGVFIIFVGESVTMNYESLLQYFSPIITCLYKNYILEHETSISVPQDENYFNLNLADSEISGRLFSVKKFSDVNLVGIVIKMFKNLDLLAPMRIIDQELFLTTILLIRSEYEINKNPFHNWLHAIDTTQFIYSCLMRGKMRRYFTPIQMAALLMAALCHDVGHTGVNTTFHVKAKTSLFYTFGEQSTLECYHATKAYQILQNSPIFNGIDNVKFWNFFINAIVATDMVRHFEFIENFKSISDKFEFGNESHQLILAQFLIKCGNIANTTRTFDVAFLFGNGLLDEYKMQTEKEKEINVELTKFADEENGSMPLWSIEVAFYTGIVGPMLKLLSAFIPDLSDFRLQMEDNQRQWEEYGRQQLEKEKNA